MVYIVGLNSGSSFDGVEAVLCKIELGADGHPTPPQYVAALTIDWPEELRKDVIRAFANQLSIFELTRLNYAAGALYADATNTLLAENHLTAEDVDGGYPCGLFIVESGLVAARTNITTVTQFRPVDHALGGSGAPLMQYLDFVAFRGHGSPVVTLNIGGIANLQLADSDRSKMMAFDTGPGNVMIDHVMRVRLGQEYDRNGEMVAKGTPIEALLQELLGHTFFHSKPPRSTWRLDFGSAYADDIVERFASSSAEDLISTLTVFTVASIENGLVDFVQPRAPILKEVVASGGGTRNTTLMELLADRVAKRGLKLCVSNQHGMPAAYKEAIKFATLAFAAKRGLANNIPAASGASGFAVLGKLTMASRLAQNT